MKKIKSTLPNIVLSLGIICLAMGAALAVANKYTEGPIAAAKAAKLQSAIKNVVPEFDNDPTAEMYTIAVTETDFLTVYPATKGGEAVGYAIESYSKNGFCGLIRVLVGINADGKLYNYTVLEHKETPGLGTKMEEWFRREDRSRQNIIGRDLTQGALRLSKDGGDIDAITAATISARAFLEAVNLAYAAFSGDDLDTISGATN